MKYKKTIIFISLAALVVGGLWLYDEYNTRRGKEILENDQDQIVPVWIVFNKQRTKSEALATLADDLGIDLSGSAHPEYSHERFSFFAPFEEKHTIQIDLRRGDATALKNYVETKKTTGIANVYIMSPTGYLTEEQFEKAVGQ